MIDAGKILLLDRGDYSSETEYEILDSVMGEDRIRYFSKVNNNIGNPLSDNTKWAVLAYRGDTGKPSESINDAVTDTEHTWSSKKIKTEIDAKKIDVDSELSDTSTNPVQNKVITTKLSKLNSDGTLDFSNVGSKPTTLSGYGITDAYTKSNTYSKTEVDNKLDSWFSQTQQATATGEQNVIFTGLDTTKAYELWFETTDGSQVGIKSSSLSGTTMTYVVDIPSTCPVPVNFKLRVIK